MNSFVNLATETRQSAALVFIAAIDKKKRDLLIAAYHFKTLYTEQIN